MTEYRVSISYQSSDIRPQVFPKKTLEKAQKMIDALREQYERGGLSPYWDGYEAAIETREVSKWTPIN